MLGKTLKTQGVTSENLWEALGDETRVSKILSGQRQLTVDMIRNLHTQFQIPFESLFGIKKLALC